MFLRAKVCAYFQSAKQWGTAGKNRETEGNAVIFLTLLPVLIFLFSTFVLVKVIQC